MAKSHSNKRTSIPRQMGLFTLTALVAGNMIGSGVFGLPSSLAQYGTISLLAWAITAFGAILLALVFCKLSTLVPHSGGPYAYCRAAFGDFMGFVVAFNYWIAIWVGNAAIAVACTEYMSVFIPALRTSNEFATFFSIGLVWTVTLINLFGVRQAGFFQILTTVLKLLPLLFIALIGLFHVHPEYLKNFNISGHSHWHALNAAAALTMWSFIGVESATVPSENVKDPARNIPRATIIGTFIAATVYLLAGITVMGVIPMQELQLTPSPFADAAELIIGPIGKILIAFGAVISTLGALNGWILLQGQIPLAAAKDQLFPKIFRKCTKDGTPAFGLVLSSVLITALLLMNGSSDLVEQFKITILLATMASLMVYFLSTIACIELLPIDKLKPKQKIKILALCFLALLYSFWTIVGSGKDIIFYGSLLFFGCMPLYIWICWQKKHS